MARNYLKFLRYLFYFLVAMSIAFCLKSMRQKNADAEELETGRARLAMPAKLEITSTPESRVQLLTQAVEEGRFGNLHFLRPEYSEYQTLSQEELSKYKQALLQGLIDRFIDSDWKYWPGAYDEQSKTFTTARDYADSVSTLNFEIGRFLDTGGYLLAQIRNRIDANLNLVLEEFIKNAEKHYSFRNSPAIGAHQRVDYSILKDPAFTSFVQQYEANSIIDRIHAGNVSVKKALAALAELDTEFSEPVVLEIFEHLCLKESAEDRIKLGRTLSAESALFSLAQQSDALRKIMSQYFAMLSVDYLEQSDYKSAIWALDLSKRVLPNTSTQAKIDSFLKLANAQLQADQEEGKDEGQSFSQIVRNGTHAAGRGIGTVIVYILIACVLALLGFRMLLSFWNKRAMSSDGGSHYASMDDDFEADTSGGDEIEFDSLEDLDALLDSQN